MLIVGNSIEVLVFDQFEATYVMLVVENVIFMLFDFVWLTVAFVILTFRLSIRGEEILQSVLNYVDICRGSKLEFNQFTMHGCELFAAGWFEALDALC